MRKKLIESGVMVHEDNHLRFVQDYQFKTPSGAAAVILGGTANGWLVWKNKDKKTLNEVKRPEVVE
jgi:Domain of unknown function (DUF4357)